MFSAAGPQHAREEREVWPAKGEGGGKGGEVAAARHIKTQT